MTLFVRQLETLYFKNDRVISGACPVVSGRSPAKNLKNGYFGDRISVNAFWLMDIFVFKHKVLNTAIYRHDLWLLRVEVTNCSVCLSSS